ncbi:sigma-54-dependent transcriptional regulator [Roseospirillum parvum]|uniref:DNA-binding transcriptional response regulator, NtrC family, contains REC, AAA-type ATPase, and a Fis-type DNA-binding domains n=1 Tax=Roseospirillum parvum TaxID=83401 RepID=A0A1G7W9D1_9PROT|nr:sigma-54 dependent transcriptional regulator [Roseospirillum parvum]SDG68573.1 DNA-binding transcriptional response regulator, NtrC family, contains REC, AAA-type ATPase, and a Fis-type DNA-binding domains [Roseospirillum parvum]
MRLLIIGSLGGQIGAASRLAMQRGAKVIQADDIDGGVDILRHGGADLVMIDVTLDVDRLIGMLDAERIATPVVAAGVGSDTQAAVRAIKAGAREYVPLPPDAELIAAILEAVTADAQALIHADPAMAKLLAMAEKIAPSEASVLICGESGTGKEMIARHIHQKSRRAEREMIAVNCAAIPENLLESELFGHEKGAFTGAVARRVGKFEEASGSTLLLDEISEMDPRLQAKLLRAIQERVIDRVGGRQPVKVDVRLIATTNRDLAEEVRKGTFREDLYFRLNVVTVALPPLRQRPADIDVLIPHFVRKYSQMNDLPERPVNAQARDLLRRHRWPGNVRELENTLHRAVLLAQGPEIDPDAIALLDGPSVPGATSDGDPAALAGTGTAGLVGRTVADVERDLILETLGHTLGNRTHAANILGISIRTLRNKLRQYGDEGLSVPPPPGEARPAPGPTRG